MSFLKTKIINTIQPWERTKLGQALWHGPQWETEAGGLQHEGLPERLKYIWLRRQSVVECLSRIYQDLIQPGCGGKVTLSETAPTANFIWGHTDRLVGTHRQTREHTGVHTKARGQLVGISSLILLCWFHPNRTSSLLGFVASTLTCKWILFFSF